MSWILLQPEHAPFKVIGDLTDFTGNVYVPIKLEAGSLGMTLDGKQFIFNRNKWDPYKVPGFDNADNMHMVKSMQKKFRDCFSRTNQTSLNSAFWTQGINVGVTLLENNNDLVATMGLPATTDLFAYSKELFTIPLRLNFAFLLSQRVANQTIDVGVSTVDAAGIPDFKNTVYLRFDGTVNTTASLRIKNNDGVEVATAHTTAATSAQQLFDLELTVDEVTAHNRGLNSTNARSNSLCMQTPVPDPNAQYCMFMRFKNVAVQTVATVITAKFMAISDYAELTAEITAGRGNIVPGQGIPVIAQGFSAILGQAAHDAAGSGSPVKIGGRAFTANYTAVATGDAADLTCTTVGVLIQKPFSIPEADWQYAPTTPIVNTTDVVLKAAGAAGIKNYLTGLQLKNTNAVATEVVVKDGSTVIWRGHLNASMTDIQNITFQSPLKGTAATALNFAAITTAASVYVNAQGYQAP